MSQMLMATGHAACGKGTSATTAAAVEIECGFKPQYVRVVVIDTNCMATEWYEGMDAGKGVQLKENTGFKLAQLAANGITVNDRGFTLGTGCQVNAKAYYWVALG